MYLLFLRLEKSNMKNYLNMILEVGTKSIVTENRTGTNTHSIFGHMERYDLSEGFPIVTTKYINFKAVVAELLWFIKGYTDTNRLESTIWDAWAYNDSIGPMYGEQFRSWPDYEGGHVDQLHDLIEGIKTNPKSRRHIISTWNVADLPDESLSPQDNVANGKMALAPCHGLPIHFSVREGKLDCLMYQRSGDLFLGVPFNIASYALLTHMVADQCGLEVGIFSHVIGDLHVYENHIEQIATQYTRDPYALPTLKLNKNVSSIFKYKPTDIELINYKYHPKLHGSVAV